MRANANYKPEQFTKSHGKLFYNYNIIQSMEVDEETGEKRTSFNYEYVEVVDKTKASIINAIMRDKYTVNDEIAFINNKFRGETKDLIDYDDYQAERVKVKNIVNTVSEETI